MTDLVDVKQMAEGCCSGRLIRRCVLLLILLLSIVALVYESRSILRDYVRPLFVGRESYFHDFQFFHEAAQRFLKDPRELYEGNTEDGFLLIESQTRINYGYPPTAVLLFTPLALLPLAWAYSTFVCLGLVLLGVAFLLLKRIIEPDGEARGGWLAWAAIGLFLVSCGPTYVTFAFGQVNIVVLVVSLACILMLKKERYVLAGLLAAIGFWIKFYPIMLMALAPLEKKPWRLMLSAGLSVVLIPVLLLPVLPAELYVQYFGSIYPEIAGQIAPHVYNQSIQAYVSRLVYSRELMFSWGPFITPPSARLVNAACAVLLVGWIWLSFLFRRERHTESFFAMLAAVPLIVPYGWGGTYMLALPLFVLLFLRLVEYQKSARLFSGSMALVLVSAVFISFLLPSYRPFAVPLLSGGVIEHIFYSRYMMLNLFAILLLTWPTGMKLMRGRA